MQRIKSSLRVCRFIQLITAVLVLALSIKLSRDMDRGVRHCRVTPIAPPDEPRTIGSLGSSEPLGSSRRGVEVTEEYCMRALQHYPQILVTSAVVGGFGIFDAALELTFRNVPFLALLVVDTMATTIYLSTGIIFAKTYAHPPKEFAFGLRACDLWSYCSLFQADIAFLFIGSIATVTAGVLVILYRRARANEDIELASPGESVH